MSETTDFWRGDFGNDYAARNSSPDLIKNNEALFRKALAPMLDSAPGRIIEFGANIGLNIHALRRIPQLSICEYTAVEPNEVAADALRAIDPEINVHQTSMQDTDEPWGGGYDLSFTRGVLIHVPPADLPLAYRALYRASQRFILLCEYHNPKPVEIEYRGHLGKLFKRDFAAEMLSTFPDLRVANYGFAWRYDPNAPNDDLVWTLLERR